MASPGTGPGGAYGGSPGAGVPPGGGGPSGGGRSQLDLRRAGIVVVVAIVVGVLLLQVGNRPAVGSSASTTTTSVASPPTTVPPTTTTTVPPSSITVLVANGTESSGVAGDYTDELQSKGYNVMPAADATTDVSASAVYYAPGQQGAAQEVAGVLSVPGSEVQALSSSTPVPNTSGADVVVVIGPDLAANPPTTTAG